MEVTTAKYIADRDTGENVSILVTNSTTVETDGEGSPQHTICVPISNDNSDYISIMEQVTEGTLTIEDAD